MTYSLDYVKSYYKMPFLKRGMKVIMDGKTGKVTSGDGAYVRVRYDNANYSVRCHPQWEMVYYDENGEIAADYRNNGGQA
jgi:hypothetical protein